jgi:NADH pyrophosphatase NudC (nudix superfamily)
MFDRCPGAMRLRTPTLEIRTCPSCGADVEVFSNELKVKCIRCGTIVYNDIQSCIQWCKHAEECVGPELYRRLKGGKES